MMKGKSISFAEMLKNKSKTIEYVKAKPKLAQYMEEFKRDPQEDYTLYLGSSNINQTNRSNQSQYGQSRSKAQSKVFQSWIQKQSILENSNKENIFSQKSPQKWSKNGKQQSSHVPVQLTPSVSSYSNIHKTYELQPNSKVERDNQQENVLTKPSDFKKEAQQHNFNAQSSRLKKQFALITDKKIEEMEQLFSTKNHQKNPKIERLIESTQNIHNEIAQLAKKIYNEKMSRQAKTVPQQEQELLISKQQTEGNIKARNLRENQQQFASGIQNQKNRWQEAKNLVSGYLGKLQMNKVNDEAQTGRKQLKAEPNEQTLNIGFSFAMNVKQPQSQAFQQKQNQLVIDHIHQIKSQFQSKRIEDSSQFHNKIQEINVENKIIKNIQSVLYQNEQKSEETRVIENIPNSTVPAKLITSEQRISEPLTKEKYHKTVNVEPIAPSQQKSPQIQEIICNNAKKQCNLEQYDNFSTKVKGHQKLTLMSSMMKNSHQRSNKASPTTVNIGEKVPQVVTTMFNLNPTNDAKGENQAVKKQNITDLNTTNDYKSLSLNPSKKSIKDVKVSIISPLDTASTIAKDSSSPHLLKYTPINSKPVKLDIIPEENKYFDKHTINEKNKYHPETIIQRQNKKHENPIIKHTTIRHQAKLTYRQKENVENIKLLHLNEKNLLNQGKQKSSDSLLGQSSEFIFDI